MDQKPSTSQRKKRKIGLHWIIAFIFLLIPVSVCVYYYIPQYNRYTALGEIVSVREIGVQGSVQFVYVREGVTRNLYEKQAVSKALPDARFYPADSSALDDLADTESVGEEARNETIEHAIDSTIDLSDVPATEEEKDAELSRLIKATSRYYGDSIGLMLGIGLVEEKEHLDFSQNGEWTVAGTGTLEADELVGSVGAIRDKLRTAEQSGADIFLVPKDKDTFLYEGLSNEEEAQQVAQELHLHLQVVPVASLSEAIAYLKSKAH